MAARKRSRSRSPQKGKEDAGTLLMRECGMPELPEMDPPKLVSMRPRKAEQTRTMLITVTKNNQGTGGGSAYCLAGLTDPGEGEEKRLIRVVPGMGHFWSDATLPPQLREMHDATKSHLSWEPQWQFRPVMIGFEAGTLPDSVTGPHKSDDWVARKLRYLGEVEEEQLYEELDKIAINKLYDVWPRDRWATTKSLKPEAQVPSLVVIRGHITWTEWRPMKSPLVDIQFGDVLVKRVPYAAHRLHDDRGYKMLEWMKERGKCMMLLGLSREFIMYNSVPQCPILLLRAFPITGDLRAR
mmetsp:Transcript_48077/g.126965  ORF Transcript_48077/g.126965 Transcript_48077/m.126965 type:complete len:297 (+) Transcript_48077:3-893(+)